MSRSSIGSERDFHDHAEVALEVGDLVVVLEDVLALDVDEVDVGPDRERALVPRTQRQVDPGRAVAEEGAQGVEVIRGREVDRRAGPR